MVVACIRGAKPDGVRWAGVGGVPLGVGVLVVVRVVSSRQGGPEQERRWRGTRVPGGSCFGEARWASVRSAFWRGGGVAEVPG